MPGFRHPDMSGSLDLTTIEAAIPQDAMTRGMFFADIADALRKRGLPPPEKPYNAFGNYAQRDFILFAGTAARTIHPDCTQREALRRLGQSAYPTFKQNILGKVMFGVLGNDVGAIMKLVPKGYAATLTHGRAEYVEGGPGFAHIKLTDIHTFLDSYQVGLFEGTLLACEKRGSVKVRYSSPTSGEFYVEWT